MTVTPNLYGNNPFQPGMVQDAFIPDQLIGGDMKIVTETKLITGGAYYKRGTVLGRINTSGATSAVKASGANTGNGTFVIDPTTPVLANADAGVYSLRFTSATRCVSPTRVAACSATSPSPRRPDRPPRSPTRSRAC